METPFTGSNLLRGVSAYLGGLCGKSYFTAEI